MHGHYNVLEILTIHTLNETHWACQAVLTCTYMAGFWINLQDIVYLFLSRSVNWRRVAQYGSAGKLPLGIALLPW